MMSSRCELPNIGEVQILRDQEPSVSLGPFPDNLIGLPVHTFVFDRIRFVAEPLEDPNQRGR